MDERIGIVVILIKFLMDLVKRFIPSLQGRTTQFVLVVVSLAGALLLIGTGDITKVFEVAGAIFAGSMAVHQVLKKEP